MLRADDDRFIHGLTQLGTSIKDQGAVAFLQVNHTGRYAFGPDRLAPSPFPTGDVIPKEMSPKQIEEISQAHAAGRSSSQAGGL